MDTTDGNVSDGYSTASAFTSTTSNGGNHMTPGLVVLGTFLFAFVAVGTVANVLVLLAYKFEKKLRKTFAILVGHLAATDLVVSACPMVFYTISIVYGYWPLGRALCCIWVVVDYNCVLASTYTLAAISVDRLWAIKWGVHYRNHNTKKKAAITIFAIW